MQGRSKLFWTGPAGYTTEAAKQLIVIPARSADFFLPCKVSAVRKRSRSIEMHIYFARAKDEGCMP